MSLHRQAAKRDANESAIRAALHARGWHTEQVSGKGMPDLIGWSKHRVNAHLLEVKMPGKDATDAQVTKWTELLTRGIHVYVLRTTEDVQALTLGHYGPWLPPLVTADAKTPLRVVRSPGSGAIRAKRADPRREEKACAAAQKRCGCTIEVECAECSKVGG